jgi:hypothetical protein
VSRAATLGNRSNPLRAAVGAGGALGAFAVVLVSLLAGYGWLYLLRGLGWLAGGRLVGDALPLLQLAGFDRQPLARVVVPWLLAGLIAGAALIRVRPLPRVALAGPLALFALLLASQVAYALTRNLRLSDVIFSRHPGLGPVLEAALFGIGCALPGSVSRGDRRGTGGVHGLGALGGLRHFSLSGGEHRDAAEHDGDREPVRGDGDRAAT